MTFQTPQPRPNLTPSQAPQARPNFTLFQTPQARFNYSPNPNMYSGARPKTEPMEVDPSLRIHQQASGFRRPATDSMRANAPPVKRLAHTVEVTPTIREELEQSEVDNESDPPENLDLSEEQEQEEDSFLDQCLPWDLNWTEN